MYMKFGMLPLPVGLFKLMLNFFFNINNNQSREPYVGGFRKNMFKTGLSPDTYNKIPSNLVQAWELAAVRRFLLEKNVRPQK